MPDLLFVAITVGFFVLAAGFVAICDRIIGPDADNGGPVGAGEADADTDDASDPAGVAPLAVGSPS